MRFMTAFSAALLMAPVLASPANAVEYDRVDTAKSSIKFVPTLMGSKTEGRFSKFMAQVRFDPEKPANASAKAEVNIRTKNARSQLFSLVFSWLLYTTRFPILVPFRKYLRNSRPITLSSICL